MAFRADEAARTGYESVEAYLVSRSIDDSERGRSREALREIADDLGPVVDSYPSWHPLVRHHDDRHPTTVPGNGCGYKGIDHTRFFANGFITCPYGDGQDVIDSVNALPRHPVATVTAERLDVQFYKGSLENSEKIVR